MNACSEGFAISHGEVRLPDWLMKMDISKGAKLTYNVLATCSRGNDFTWPTQEYLAGRLSSSVRTVQRHLGELVSHGLIEKGREYARGKVRCVYRFLTGQNIAVKTASQQHDKLSSCPPESQKKLSQNTTFCRTKSDILSCSLNREETINENNSLSAKPDIPVVQAEGSGELTGKRGDLFLELKEEDLDWAKAKDILKGEIPSGSFQTWIAPLIFERNGSAVILRGSNNFFCNWVKTHFGDEIGKALTTVGLAEWKLDTLTPEQQKLEAARLEEAEKLQKEAICATAKAAVPPDENVDSLPLDEQFERLYAIYPRNYEGKGEAQDTFCELHRKKKLPETSVLIATIKRAKNNNPSWIRNAERFAPQLEKWLKKRRWMD